MDKLQWLKERQKSIGGSDVGAIMGVNKWKSAFQVYIEKTEDITEVPEASEAAYWGTNFKELVSKEFMKRTGKKVRRYNKQIAHKQYPFITANIDRRVLGENSLLLCKTTSVFGAKGWEGEEVPPSYILQCQHYMAVSGADKCYLALLAGGQKLIIKEILMDQELIEMIIAAETEFWAGHVILRLPPSLDSSVAADKYLKDKYPKANSLMEVDLREENKDRIKRYLSLKQNIKVMEDEAKTLENNIKNELGEAEKGVVSHYIVNWKVITSNRVDSKILKDRYPVVYDEVCKETISRRFEVRVG
jgi:putative phage-type endonuclease